MYLPLTLTSILSMLRAPSLEPHIEIAGGMGTCLSGDVIGPDKVVAKIGLGGKLCT